MCWVPGIERFGFLVDLFFSYSTVSVECIKFIVQLSSVYSMYRLYPPIPGTCSMYTRYPGTTYNFKNIINRSLIFVFVYHLFSLLF